MHLVLNKFICGEFGHRGMDAMLDRLGEVPDDLRMGAESEYARALYIPRTHCGVTAVQMREYDDNIVRHSQRLRMTGEHGRIWKPYQYLALLFAEHYLRRYFEDPEALCRDLNRARCASRDAARLPEYALADLRTIAFQSATGSGKTLIMHAHLLQYQHYLERAGGRLNNIILLTPNERMSEQHERECRGSGLAARLFSADAGSGLFRQIEIIDQHKLNERKGVKRVAVRDFGGNNLVLVDEGHLGASGRVWRERRRELSRGGFTFEYSATFNQIAGAGKESELLNTYSKCLLFDYGYRRFHGSGYGKDYSISNLPQGVEDSSSRMYMLGCLLTFYQQCRIWRDKGGQWADFNLARPLWVFLGKTVMAGGRVNDEARSDIASILHFLAWVLAHRRRAGAMMAGIIKGQSGLMDDRGGDYFANRFDCLRGLDAGDLHGDVCRLLFHGAGKLHVVQLGSGDGELHLRSADNEVFGVVNVGDSAKLRQMLERGGGDDMEVERDPGLRRRLFADVDRADSRVNIVIGARKFIAGWNSWRVSTMGLMHVGVGEGPEIIQMFGRGVRLKGWRMSLKRHQHSGAANPPDGGQLARLETLYIFGLRSQYMEAFRKLLDREGMIAERIGMPVTWNFGKKQLRLIRVPAGLRFARAAERPVLPGPDADGIPHIIMDLYPQLQAVESTGVRSEDELYRVQYQLDDGHRAFVDAGRIRSALLARKRRDGWHNLVIRPEVVDALIASGGWYTLHAPPERLQTNSFADALALEELLIKLLCEYAGRFWRAARRRWEGRHMEVVMLDENDPNRVREYQLSADENRDELVRAVQEFNAAGREGHFHALGLGSVAWDNHAYRPLLYAGRNCEVSVRPVALNGHERMVVEDMTRLAREKSECLQGRELCLIRNLTRGRGVSFFDDFGYYPDFIVWLSNAESQHVIFLDPKGLSRYGNKERGKVELHSRIKDIEADVQKKENGRNLYLHACILSTTDYAEIGNGGRTTAEEWHRMGVYSLRQRDYLERVFASVLGRGQP